MTKSQTALVMPVWVCTVDDPYNIYIYSYIYSIYIYIQIMCFNMCFNTCIL